MFPPVPLRTRPDTGRLDGKVELCCVDAAERKDGEISCERRRKTSRRTFISMEGSKRSMVMALSVVLVVETTNHVSVLIPVPTSSPAEISVTPRPACRIPPPLPDSGERGGKFFSKGQQLWPAEPCSELDGCFDQEIIVWFATLFHFRYRHECQCSRST